MEHTKKPDIGSDIQEIEFDEMWGFLQKKVKNSGIIKAVDRSRRRTIAWVAGGRDVATSDFIDKIKHLKNCRFYTDDWDAFAKVLSKILLANVGMH